MDNPNTEKQNLTLDQLEKDAKEAGRVAKINLLPEEGALSEEGTVSFATELAQLYLQKHVEQLDTSETTLYMQHFLRLFRAGYMETERRIGGVSYHPNIWQ